MPSPRSDWGKVQRLARSACTRTPQQRRLQLRLHAAVGPGACVLVAGATGGVGQLVTAKLLDRGYQVRALCRNREKATQLFPPEQSKKIEIVYADLRDASAAQRLTESIDAVCCVTGTTAFPSQRWKGNNGPQQTDYVSVKNLIDACPGNLQRFILNTSAGVDRSGSLPFSILNLFGVLRYKKEAERVLQSSGLPYTIVRPGRLTDGPYTSYDLNTLLQATSGSRQNIRLSPNDDLNGQTSRLACAEAIVQALQSNIVENRAFALESSDGQGPGSDAAQWKALFSAL
ncbi:hypothetical protein WJX73_000226 [Symbiochloris irregularis]|uniref:NAD(P)-binding domain-containing protein n=1 Tax=Symbiochloris irregularis TaxID=706552 RepID=A0AAW1PNJ8_9CHLO